MERSGTLSEPSDNSTTPYIKKRDQPFWVSLVFLFSALFFLRRSFLFFFLSFSVLPPFFLRSFCADRYSSHDFVPIKRFRWYQVYQLMRFVPQKRFKRYKRALKTCFVRGKRFRWNGSRLPDRTQAVGDTFQSFIQKLARTCQVDADEAFSRFAVH